MKKFKLENEQLEKFEVALTKLEDSSLKETADSIVGGKIGYSQSYGQSPTYNQWHNKTM